MTFDQVRISYVIIILNEKEVPTQLVQIIRDIYINRGTKILFGNKIVTKIECKGGFTPSGFAWPNDVQSNNGQTIHIRKHWRNAG